MAQTVIDPTLQSAPTSSLRPIIIEPSRPWALLDMRELWAFRDLLVILVLRDVRLRYKQTALGVIWVVLQPLVAALIFAVIFGRFANLPTDGSPYLLFVFAGMLPWNLFANALQRSGGSLVGDARLISKVYFPRIVIPVASTLAVLVDFAVALLVMLVLLIGFRVPFRWELVTLPLLIGMTMLVAVGVGLFISALNVYYRDFMYALPFLIQVLMYASPVVYTSTLVPEAWKPLYALNPMVGVIEGFRWALLGARAFPALELALSLVVGLLLVIGGMLVFQRVEQNFADVI